MADEFYLDAPALASFQRQMVVAHTAFALQFIKGRARGDYVFEEADLPKSSAQEPVARITKQIHEEGIHVKDLSRAGIEDQNAILCGFKEPPVTRFRNAQSRLRAFAFCDVSDEFEQQGFSVESNGRFLNQHRNLLPIPPDNLALERIRRRL